MKDGVASGNRNDVNAPGATETRGGIDWTDATVPVGDAPRLPRWPLYLLAVCWTGWVLFLLGLVVAGRTAGA